MRKFSRASFASIVYFYSYRLLFVIMNFLFREFERCELVMKRICDIVIFKLSAYSETMTGWSSAFSGI